MDDDVADAVVAPANRDRVGVGAHQLALDRIASVSLGKDAEPVLTLRVIATDVDGASTTVARGFKAR